MARTAAFVLLLLQHQTLSLLKVPSQNYPARVAQAPASDDRSSHFLSQDNTRYYHIPPPPCSISVWVGQIPSVPLKVIASCKMAWHRLAAAGPTRNRHVHGNPRKGMHASLDRPTLPLNAPLSSTCKLQVGPPGSLEKRPLFMPPWSLRG